MGIFSFVKPGKKVFQTIKSVKPNVPTTKKQKLSSKLAIAKQQTKGSAAKLKQTLFDIKEKTKKGRVYSGKELEQQKYFKDMNKGRENKMGGGMMGRRFGMKKGTPNPFKKETNVDKIKKTFAPKRKKKFPDLTGDGKVTFADILKGRGVINGKKKKA